LFPVGPLHDAQGVGGSNPSRPTTVDQRIRLQAGALQSFTGIPDSQQT
jgi:hypothetical protein